MSKGVGRCLTKEGYPWSMVHAKEWYWKILRRMIRCLHLIGKLMNWRIGEYASLLFVQSVEEPFGVKMQPISLARTNGIAISVDCFGVEEKQWSKWNGSWMHSAKKSQFIKDKKLKENPHYSIREEVKNAEDRGYSNSPFQGEDKRNDGRASYPWRN